MNFRFKSSAMPTAAAPPTAPPMEYYDDGDNGDFPIAVAIPVPPPAPEEASAASHGNDEEMPPRTPPLAAAATTTNPITTTTTIDRSTNNARDGSLRLSINTTTHYPNGHRERKIEYYRIPRNMAKKVSAALDNGHMPSTSYLIRMEQQSLPPGTAELPMHPPSLSTAIPTTMVISTGEGGRHHHTHLGSDGRKCGICWCTTCTLCIGTFFVIVAILVAVFMIQPWSKVVHSSFPSWHDENTNTNNDYHDGSVSEWMTLVPSTSPPP